MTEQAHNPFGNMPPSDHDLQIAPGPESSQPRRAAFSEVALGGLKTLVSGANYLNPLSRRHYERTIGKLQIGGIVAGTTAVAIGAIGWADGFYSPRNELQNQPTAEALAASDAAEHEPVPYSQVEAMLRRPRIFSIGDSLTVGMEKTQQTTFDDAGIDSSYEAKNGRTIKQATLEIEDHDSDAIAKATAIVVGIGTNSRGEPPYLIEQQINRVMDDIYNLNPNAKVFLTTIFVEGDKANTDKVNEIIKRIADQWKQEGRVKQLDTGVLDWYKMVMENGGPEAFGISLANEKSKGRHPNNDGYLERIRLFDEILIPEVEALHRAAVERFAKEEGITIAPEPNTHKLKTSSGKTFNVSDTRSATHKTSH